MFCSVLPTHVHLSNKRGGTRSHEKFTEIKIQEFFGNRILCVIFCEKWKKKVFVLEVSGLVFCRKVVREWWPNFGDLTFQNGDLTLAV